MYVSANYLTRDIARKYGITARTVQKIVRRAGVSRTREESNKAIVHLKDYSKNRVEQKAERKHLSRKKRYTMIESQPYCTLCGNRPPYTVLHVDHIDNNATNNADSNLQVLCIECNYGKR